MLGGSTGGPGEPPDAGELQRLYEANWNEVVRVVMSVLGPARAAEAQDVAQDVFLEGFSRIGSLRNPEAFGSWIRRIAWRRAIDRTRLASYRMPHEPIEAAADSTAAGNEAGRIDRSLDVESALARLPEKHRAVLRMFYWLGMDVSEIAAALDVAEGTVKSLLSRGRKRVGASIRKDGAER